MKFFIIDCFADKKYQGNQLMVVDAGWHKGYLIYKSYLIMLIVMVSLGSFSLINI